MVCPCSKTGAGVQGSLPRTTLPSALDQVGIDPVEHGRGILRRIPFQGELAAPPAELAALLRVLDQVGQDGLDRFRSRAHHRQLGDEFGLLAADALEPFRPQVADDRLVPPYTFAGPR